MKKFYYFLMLICAITLNFTSCKEWLGQEGELIPLHDTTEIVKTDTLPPVIIVITPDMVVVERWSDKDTIVVSNDTIYWYRDSVGITPPEVVESYHLYGDKLDNGSNYFVAHTTEYSENDEVVLSTGIDRSAEIKSASDSIFVPKVSSLQATVGRPNVTSDYDVNGEFDINTEYKDYKIMADDGWTCEFSAENQSASAMYNGKKKNLLYLKDIRIDVKSIKDEMTTDTVIKDKKIYCRAKRTVEIEQESRLRPVMGQEIANKDTLRASFDNVYIEVGEVHEDTVPVIPPDTIPVPPDTIPVNPDTVPVVIPDSGYTIENEKIESITFSYTIGPDATLKEVLLVRTKSYVLPIVSRQILSPIAVANPNDYNSVAWVNGAWRPANLRFIDGGFVWSIDGTDVSSATDATIDWLAGKTGISSLSRSDFLKEATFVNEGTTTRVYVDNVLYMTLSK